MGFFHLEDRCEFANVKGFSTPIPEPQTEGSAGADFYVAEDTVLEPWKVTYIPTGIKAYIPHGHFLLLALRSSAPKKYNIMMANGIGVIDRDYVDNPENEGHIKVAVVYFGKDTLLLGKGERIAQGIMTPYKKVGNSTKKRDGGFGSTGNI